MTKEVSIRVAHNNRMQSVGPSEVAPLMRGGINLISELRSYIKKCKSQ
jgi:hypothetical protein